MEIIIIKNIEIILKRSFFEKKMIAPKKRREKNKINFIKDGS